MIHLSNNQLCWRLKIKFIRLYFFGLDVYSARKLTGGQPGQLLLGSLLSEPKLVNREYK